MPEDIGIKSYIEGFSIASNRTRSVLILITIASVLIFSGLWNARPQSWINSRARIAQAAIRGCNAKWDTSSISKDETQLYDQAREFLQVRGVDVNDCAIIKEIATEAAKIRVEDSMVIHVPFFGAVLDVNDLGLIGGFTFWILLLWFRFSLRRELSNLELVFLVAGERDESLASYDLVAMRQVLNLPRIREQPLPHDGRRYVRFLYYLPAVLQAWVVGIDVETFKYGWSVNPTDVIVVYAGSLFALGMIIVFTVHCRRLSSRIEAVWEREAELLGLAARPATRLLAFFWTSRT